MGQWLYLELDSSLHQYIPSARKIEVLSVRLLTEKSNPDKKGLHTAFLVKGKKKTASPAMSACIGRRR